MNVEDRLTEVLHDTAEAYTPRYGLGRIEDKVAGRRRARRIRNVALPVAAAVIAAIAVPLALRGGKQHSERITGVPPVATTVPAGPTTEAAAPAPARKPAVAPPPSAPTAFQGPLGGPVPPGFVASSVTFVSSSHGWVLGNSPCPSTPCVASLVRTTDGGHTWRGIPGPPTRLASSIYDPTGVADVRFANDRDGFAFGPALWTTHDGGAHWRQLPDVAGVSPYSVPSLTATPAGVYAVVQDGGHTNRFQLVHGDPGGDTFSVVHDFGPDTSVVNMAAGGSTVYVTFVPSGSQGPALARLQGKNFVTRRVPDPSCDTLAPSSATDLLLHCGFHQAQGGQGARTLYGTTNGGDTWTKLPAPGRGGGWVTSGVADAGGGHAVIATSDAGGAGLLVTTDGAQHWREVLHMDNTAGTGWADLGFENRTTGVVIFGPGQTATDPGGGALYRTTDGGVTWSKISFSA